MIRTPPSALRQNTAIASPGKWITHVAFVLALAVMIARLTTPDVLRDPWGPTLGATGAGASTGLVFDLLAALPAVSVLIRSAIDRQFQLTFRPSHCILFALAIWAVASTAWSADRFAAALTSAHFFSAGCLLWAMSQLVRSAVRFRVVAAVAFGLMLTLGAQSMLYRFVEVPEDIAYWNEKKADILKQHDWAPDSFSAKQFERKLLSGELVGFFSSANSFAAVGVLLFAACVGIGVQKIKEGEKTEWLVLPVIAGVSLVWILINARSKTSAATPFLGCGAIGVFILLRDRIRRQHGKSYLIAVTVTLTAIIAVIGHGLYHHGLFPGHFSNSLDFRWKYWVASAGVFVTHPVIGVGWGNFGLHYLAHRLPEAAEEIKDPHNFLVRFFVELGTIGGLLSMAWLLRVGWEITLPSNQGGPDRNEPSDENMTVKSTVAIVLLGMLLNVVANIDFTLPIVDVLALLMKPTLFLLALLLGTIAGAMRSPQKWTLDHRAITWIFYCTITGMGLFLLHNLIDFSWFEAGPMALFMTLIGSALGMARADHTPPRRRIFAITCATVATLGWMIAAGLFVVPVVIAEQYAAAANNSIATAPQPRSEATISHYIQAGDDLAKAAGLVPYNSDYIFRQAQAMLNAGNYSVATGLLARAKQINPLLIDAYLLDANLKLTAPMPDQAAVRADFETVLKLNPNDVPLHIEYGDALARFGANSAAVGQFKMALMADAALPIGEPKRLSTETILRLHAVIQSQVSKE